MVNKLGSFGKDRILGQSSGMPQMRAAFAGWQSIIELVRIRQDIGNDGFLTEIKEEISFRGTVQPLSTEELNLKPDGQRSFQWLQIHAETGATNLVTNDRIDYNSQPFKVMAVKDYTLNNYIEYHLVQDFTEAGTDG